MSEIERMVEQLKQAHEGEAWHGPSVAEALQGVNAAAATRRPVADGHCIWEIAHHVRVTEEAVRSDFTGQPAAGDVDWPSLSDTSEAAWAGVLTRLSAGQAALRAAVARFPEARLHESVPGKSHSYWYELQGVLHHDLYHAGQIALLKKGI